MKCVLASFHQRPVSRYVLNEILLPDSCADKAWNMDHRTKSGAGFELCVKNRTRARAVVPCLTRVFCCVRRSDLKVGVVTML
jgi:hypothetical protein